MENAAAKMRTINFANLFYEFILNRKFYLYQRLNNQNNSFYL